MEEESSVSAERVNGLSIVEKKMRGTMQFLAVEVEAGGGMLLVASAAGAELTNLARAMREAKKVLVCITFSIFFFCFFTVFEIVLTENKLCDLI